MMKTYILPVMLMMMGMFACSSSSAGESADNTATNDTNQNTTIQMAQETTPLDTVSTVKIEMKTTEGDITLLLYGDTPLHRDNMKKLVEEGYYDGVLFHRVINDFMVQTGDPDSKDAAPGARLGSGNPGYTIPAEIHYPRHFHKRGAVAAARTGDQMNPERRSSGSQFYIVTGRKAPAAQLQSMAQQSALQNHFNQLAQQHMPRIMMMQQQGDAQGLQALQQQLQDETMQWAEAHPEALEVPAELLKAYTAEGGTPHLDDQYTVFGEVISGMDVVDRIQKVETDGADRPLQDVRIISMKVIE